MGIHSFQLGVTARRVLGGVKVLELKLNFSIIWADRISVPGWVLALSLGISSELGTSLGRSGGDVSSHSSSLLSSGL